MSVRNAVKSLLLPRGAAFRRLPLGVAAGILGRRRPHLIIEVHGRRTEERCSEILGRHGYAPVVVERRRWLAETRPAGHNRWLVCEGRVP